MFDIGPTSKLLQSIAGVGGGEEAGKNKSPNKKGGLIGMLRKVMQQQGTIAGPGGQRIMVNPPPPARTGPAPTDQQVSALSLALRGMKPPLFGRQMPQQMGMQTPQVPFGSLPPLTDEDIQRMIATQQGMQ